jgi:hypothetical protein
MRVNPTWLMSMPRPARLGAPQIPALCQQPGEGNLGRSSLQLGGDRLNGGHHALVVIQGRLCEIHPGRVLPLE